LRDVLVGGILKKFDEDVYREVFISNIYEQKIQIEDNDLVLDLGCSKGYLYFKNINKQIDYIGVDASIFNIQDFITNLSGDTNPVLLNLAIDGSLNVIDFNCMFHEGSHQLVSTITFPNLLKLINRRIDFLKFDIEGYEKFIFNDLDLFKKNVHKFIGEVHFQSSLFSRQESYNLMDILNKDSDIELNIHSIDPIDITESYWDNRDHYTEVLINGIIK
jgi:SAM-dependent methyltransferase